VTGSFELVCVKGDKMINEISERRWKRFHVCIGSGLLEHENEIDALLQLADTAMYLSSLEYVSIPLFVHMHNL
jgi:hypothetical protein